eukprot:SAG31_NODE_29622_length_392_cov_0.979522_1_plen_31_part_10
MKPTQAVALCPSKAQGAGRRGAQDATHSLAP